MKPNSINMIAIAVLCVSCTAYRVPQPLGDFGKPLPKGNDSDAISVVILNSERLENAEAMASAMVRTNRFRTVQYEFSDRLKPDYVVEVVFDKKMMRMYPPCGMGMVSTLFTLGVFPFFTKDTYGSTFIIYKYGSDERISIEYEEQSESVTGLISTFYLTSKNWGRDYQLDIHYDHLSQEIYSAAKSLK